MIAHTIAHIGPVPVEESGIGGWVLLAGLAVAPLWIYLRGWSRLPGATDRNRRRGAFVAAVIILVLCLSPPAEEWADALFSAHMVQHLVLFIVAPVLLVYSHAGRCSIAGLPRIVRSSTSSLRRVTFRGLSRFDSIPVAAIVFAVVLWSWHLPVLYQVAVRNSTIHGVEHVTILAASLLFWKVAMDPRNAIEMRGILVFATGFQAGLLGAVLVFAPTVLYPIHVGQNLVAVNPLSDQQFAGVIMWFAMGGAFLVATAALMIRQLDAPNPGVATDG